MDFCGFGAESTAISNEDNGRSGWLRWFLNESVGYEYGPYKPSRV
jgi:hypothetical protein